jgi:hypothetical protein
MDPGPNGAAWSAFRLKGKNMEPIFINEITIAKQLYEQIAGSEKLEKLQLFFTSKVLDKYLQTGDFKIIRTDTSGRISRRGSWSVDFGISGENDSIIHIPVESLVHRIPDSERGHWLEHGISLPVSGNFLKGLLRPGCLDDGSIRNW